MKVAVIGDRTSVAGFKALGLDTFILREPSKARDVWRRLDLDSYAVIFLTEPVYETLAGEREQLKRQVLPVVSVIPAVTGSRHVGYEEIRTMVESAVGSDVMFRDERKTAPSRVNEKGA